jgi:fructose-1,6-bisphosphatase
MSRCFLQIFGIYMLEEGKAGNVDDILKPGTTMVAAGYCMYGSSCTVSLRWHIYWAYISLYSSNAGR